MLTSNRNYDIIIIERNKKTKERGKNKMLDMLRRLFEDGYQFVEDSYYDSCEVSDFEEVVEAYEECEEDDYLYFQYEIDEEQRVVSFIVQNEE